MTHGRRLPPSPACALVLVLVAVAGGFFPRPARADVEAYFTSANHGSDTTVVAEKIASILAGAKKSVLIAVAHFDSDAIAKALLDLHQARNKNADTADDVEIRVLLDLGEFGDKKSRSKDLEQAGINIRYKTYSVMFFQPESQLLHHKYMLVDGKDLVTGSYNWSDTAEHTNYENILYFHDRNVKRTVADFKGEFEKLWKLNREVYPSFLKGIQARPGSPDYRPVIPVHFDTPYFNTPMTLTRAEVAAIRSAVSSAGFFRDLNNKTKRFYDRDKRAATTEVPAGTFLPSAPPAAAPGGPGIIDAIHGNGGNGH
ncbi:MAG: DUF1669 domain-containing protein [Planctomycetes bacterium]|nr:DUF1669 domain-containing protein [Planctomycetota bacterium]